MLNYIWAAMILISLAVAVVMGRIEATTAAAMTSAIDAVWLVIKLTGVICMWSGLMHICERAGIVEVISRIIRPLTKKLFPQIPQKSKAMNAITLNIVANMLGLGNAATPLGINAMCEMSALNGGGKTATNAMCMFVVLNTASIQIIPTTMIALRQSVGSVAASEIILPVWVCSVLSLAVGILCTKLFENRRTVAR